MLTNYLGQQKRELLKRLATERMQALESAENTRLSIATGVAAVRRSGRFLRYVGLATAGLAAAGVCTVAAKGMRSRSKVLVSPPKSGIFRTLLLQGATIVLFPFLRELLSKRLAAMTGGDRGSSPSRQFFDFSAYNPVNLFFRWLGLDK